MGKCVDQVYFMEIWSKRLGLKIAISQQFFYANFSMIIFIYIYIYIYIFTFLYEVHFHTLTVLSAFSFIHV